MGSQSDLGRSGVFREIVTLKSGQSFETEWKPGDIQVYRDEIAGNLDADFVMFDLADGANILVQPENIDFIEVEFKEGK
jgi:hypothetical protein